MYTERDHSFVITAYKENPYLEETILSLFKQTVSSKIYISTSTPNSYITTLAEKYDIPLLVNSVRHSAGYDWSFAYSQMKTDLVTIVHQDDIYEPNFLEETLRAVNKAKKPIIVFTDYYEYREEGKVESNLILKVKRILNFLLRFRMFQNSKVIRRRILGFGCPINCPSVTYVKSNAGEDFFDTRYVNSCDYKTWVNLSTVEGSFVYIPKMLMGHRIYPESATSKNLAENIRANEDYEILCTLWPKWMAKIINGVYRLSEKSNNV